jgi:hypothetical protein
VHHALERIQDLEYVHPRVKRNISGAHNLHVPGNPWLAFLSNFSCKKFSSTIGTCRLSSQNFFSWILLSPITSVLGWKFLLLYGGSSVSKSGSRSSYNLRCVDATHLAILLSICSEALPNTYKISTPSLNQKSTPLFSFLDYVSTPLSISSIHKSLQRPQVTSAPSTLALYLLYRCASPSEQRYFEPH